MQLPLLTLLLGGRRRRKTLPRAGQVDAFRRRPGGRALDAGERAALLHPALEAFQSVAPEEPRVSLWLAIR
jgi:hypothetical protein